MSLIKADGGIFFSKDQVTTAEVGVKIDGAGGTVTVPLETIRAVQDSASKPDEHKRFAVLVTLNNGRKISLSGFDHEDEVLRWIEDVLA